MTDLSGKFSALEATMVGRLDTIITKLDTLITTIQTGGGLESAPIVAAIEAMRGTGDNNTLLSIADTVEALQGGGSTVSDLHESLTYLDGGILWTNAGQLNSIRKSLVDGGIGNATWLTRILAAIQQLGIEPDGDLEGSLQNDGSLTVDGKRFLQWPAINGVSRSEDRVQLTPQNGWQGYEVYIQSSAPDATYHDITLSEDMSMPTNSWISLAGDHTLAFSVLSNYNAIGYIRGVPAATIEIDSTVITLQDTPSHILQHHGIDWDLTPWSSYGITDDPNSNYYTLTGQKPWLSTDFEGYGIQVISGTAQIAIDGGAWQALPTSIPYVLPHTQVLRITYGAGGNSAFTIRVTPP